MAGTRGRGENLPIGTVVGSAQHGRSIYSPTVPLIIRQQWCILYIVIAPWRLMSHGENVGGQPLTAQLHSSRVCDGGGSFEAEDVRIRRAAHVLGWGFLHIIIAFIISAS